MRNRFVYVYWLNARFGKWNTSFRQRFDGTKGLMPAKEKERKSHMEFRRFIGIDVSKQKLDIYDSATEEVSTIPNKAECIKKFFGGIAEKEVLCIIENTGGYERATVEELMQLGIAIHKTDNFRVKAYMRSLGVKAKTDSIDSKALAQYGIERWQDLRLLKKSEDENEEQIKQLATYLEELKLMRASEKNRAKSGGYGKIRDFIEDNLRNIENTITQIEKKIKELIKKSEDKKAKIKKMTEVKGVGFDTAIKLLTFLPELGMVNRKEIAALAGLAPYARDSGQMRGYRTTKGNGRPRVKKALFMASLSAIRYNATIQTFFEKLLKNGKKRIVALVACMRKLLTQLNAILKKAGKESSLGQNLKEKERNHNEYGNITTLSFI